MSMEEKIEILIKEVMGMSNELKRLKISNESSIVPEEFIMVSIS